MDDLNRASRADPAPPIPESGAFVNFSRRRTLSERVYRFLERVRFVVPVTRQKPRHRSPSTR